LTAASTPRRGCSTDAEVQAALKNKKRKPVGQMQFSDKSEIYVVRNTVWAKAGAEDWGGCLCVGCLEKRLGRKLRPKDFADHPFNDMPGTPRLLERREGADEMPFEDFIYRLCRCHAKLYVDDCLGNKYTAEDLDDATETFLNMVAQRKLVVEVNEDRTRARLVPVIRSV
jgi:hypothetical protein